MILIQFCERQKNARGKEVFKNKFIVVIAEFAIKF